MTFYRDRVYPHLVTMLGNPEPIRKIRERLVPLAEGNVLEIGVGPGANLVHYATTRVSKVYALEPNRGMIRHAERQCRRTSLDVEFLDLPAERIPLADGTVDTVVSTFTLCTIRGVAEAIREMGRVLKPGGQLIFFELGLSPDPRVQRWQERTESFFKWAFEGCHVTRDIPSLIGKGGFTIERMETAYLSSFPKSGSYAFWGVARPEAVNERQDRSGNSARWPVVGHSLQALQADTRDMGLGLAVRGSGPSNRCWERALPNI